MAIYGLHHRDHGQCMTRNVTLCYPESATSVLPWNSCCSLVSLFVCCLFVSGSGSLDFLHLWVYHTWPANYKHLLPKKLLFSTFLSFPKQLFQLSLVAKHLALCLPLRYLVKIYIDLLFIQLTTKTAKNIYNKVIILSTGEIEFLYHC